MSKELEALEQLKAITKFDGGKYHTLGHKKEIKIVEKGLKRLETIDNANPSEALIYTNALIKENDYDIKSQNITGFDIDIQAKWVKYLNDKSLLLNSIKQSLIKAQEQDKVLNVIFNKPLKSATTINYLKINQIFPDMLDYEHYCLTVKEKIRNTEEEFDLLKRYLDNEKDI